MLVYVTFMSLLITAVLYYGDKKHDRCPVCNHSFVTEGFQADLNVNNNVKN
jgi:hypothetical protein